MTNAGRSAAETAEMLQLIDTAITETRSAGRPDLAEKLLKCRRQLTTGAWHVLVAGEFKKGKSALINGLLGVPVCGVDPVAFTAVPTTIKHGDKPTAYLMTEAPADAVQLPPPIKIDIRKAAEYGRTGLADDGTRLRAIETTLKRELLADGLVLVDTPGLGGGFAAAAASATMRALSLADGVIVVTDASQELTAAEVDFIKHAVDVCPNLIVVLTKTDFYPQWQRILELDRQHLRAAGIQAEIVAVSSVLRELALDTGDPALNAECGFPVLVERLGSRLLADHAAKSVLAAAGVVRNSLRQVAEVLVTEHAALTKPEERQATMRKVEASGERAKALSSPSARWLNTITDRFADIQAHVDADLTERSRRLENETTRRIKEGDPTKEWSEIVPWLQKRTNEEMTDAHTLLIRQINELADDVAALFDATAEQVDAIAKGTDMSVDLKVENLASKKGGKLEVGMHAARGWSLSSSIVTTVLVTTLAPSLLIVLPITAALGSVFAWRAVRSYKTTKVDAARAEALRAAAVYLNQARVDANRASYDLIRHSRGKIRDYYLDQAQEMVSAAKHEQEAAMRAVQADAQAAATRGAAAKAELDRVSALLASAERVTQKGRS
ncbi:dynamin family protein [Kibdelosporangium philippinense]|uniref:Dynamin family protein n=1 Tax=Kibdelosporangium philippinense TaxID=211113 RepID=A0ABS8ZU50_9PSEU|nr:dynamin family protein [Kibdelosporangium philippinense]MCE7011228.1 dynamin family protein [Kibdelosporangium philippinense]